MIKIDIDGFKKHLESRQVSKYTLESYLSDLRAFMDFLSKHPEINTWTDAIESWLSSEDIKPSTAKRRASSLKAYARWQKIGEVLSYTFRWGREVHLPKVLSSTERKKVEEAAEKYGRDHADLLLPTAVLLMSRLGLRISEVVNLRIKDINLNNMTIRIRGKGQKDAVLPIPKGMKTRLKLVYKMLGNSNADPETRIYPYHRSTLWRKVKEIGKMAGVELTPHTLRHTAATEMLKRGANLRVVQKVLRHSSIATTQKYTHLTVEDIREEMEKIGWGE